MSGISVGGSSCAAGWLYVIDVVNGGAGQIGFFRLAFGTATPAVFRTQNIQQITSQPDGGGLGTDFSIQVATVMPQDIFQELIVIEGGGAIRRYTSASAGYFAGGSTTWSWGTGTNPVWTASHGNRNVLFRL